jgi:hypothetical protein
LKHKKVPPKKAAANFARHLICICTIVSMVSIIDRHAGKSGLKRDGPVFFQTEAVMLRLKMQKQSATSPASSGVGNCVSGGRGRLKSNAN